MKRKPSRNVIKIFHKYSNNIPKNIHAKNREKIVLRKIAQSPCEPCPASTAANAGGIDKPYRPRP